jgi:predicted membrane-bound dolichyl-phosphate-mannose-protein mannosyltransferase
MDRRIQSLAVGRPRLPLVLLGILCVLSLGARAAWLAEPCRSPCRSASARVLIFDERYYVNAARVIAGIRPLPGSPYASSPLGDDPNSEHPQLVKLLIAGSIELFGDDPFAWRVGSLIAGTLAILGMFALVRAAGGGPWTALAAAALMAADNLMIVHGRIGTLDIYALAAMVWGAALYLRRRPLAAGVVIGVGLAAKLVAGYVLIALALLELLRWLRGRRRGAVPAWRFGGCLTAAAGVFIGLLALFDRIAPPYDPLARKLVGGGVFGHVGHMLSYAAQQTSPAGPRGIASYPWGWLVDYKPIVYLNVDPAHPAPGLYHVHPAVHFLGLISPPILLLALPALALACWTVLRGRERPGTQLPLLAAAWFAGAYLPFVLLSLIGQRTSYLYYMLVVMPALYVAVAWLLPRLLRWPRLTLLWAVCVVAAAVIAYPFTPLP